MNFLEYLQNMSIDKLVWACSFKSRLRGLIGKNPESFGQRTALILAPCNSIHTLFMKHSITVAFVNKEGDVLEIYKNVSPGQFILRNPKAQIVIETFS